MTAGQLIVAHWTTQFRAVRMIADQIEKRELAECEQAALRLRLSAMAPVIAKQVFGRSV